MPRVSETRIQPLEGAPFRCPTPPCSPTPARVDTAEATAVSHAGAVVLTDTFHATCLAGALREAPDPWTKPLTEHHAGKVLLDPAIVLAIGGVAARNADLLRCEPGPSGRATSLTTVSRMLTTLAQHAPTVLREIPPLAT